MALAPVYRGTEVILNKYAEDSNIVQELNGRDFANIKFDAISPVELLLGDFITIENKKYTLNLLPTITKTGDSKYHYDCIFESRMYELSKILYTDGVNSEFSLTGDLDFFISNIITNLNRVQSGWAKGNIRSGTETKNLQFSNENCLEVLQRLCGEYKLEFKVNENLTIDVGEFGTILAQSFAYGRGHGLYSLTRKTVESKNLFTRLYPFGGERNIPANYRNYSTRLKIETDYIQKNFLTYGIIEAAKIFDDIYPRFKGAVTSLGATTNIVSCSTIDFDLNSYLIAGTSAKIHFNTGVLAGYEFDISTYTHTTKEITLKYSSQEKVFSDEGLTEYVLPNDTIKPAVGDEFVFLDITMPDSYVIAAEAELLAEAQTLLDQNCDPRVTYTLDIDPKYARENAIIIEPGDYVPVVDSALGINKTVRVIGVTKSIYEPIKWDIDLADTVSPQIINRVIADVEDIRRLIVVNKLGDIARAKRNWRSAEDLRASIFDPDGYFDLGLIKPESISTLMLSTGSRAGNFTLSSTIEPNYQRDKTKVRFSAGTLVHFQIESEIRTWTITENIVTGLADATIYYIYARCARVGSGAILLSDTVQRKVDSDPTYYYFPVGILTAVLDGWRDAIMTYGQAYMVGKFLNVGQITGASGLIIDLDTGDIRGKITFSNGYTEDDVAGAIEGVLDPADLEAEPLEVGDISAHYSFDEVIGNKIYENTVKNNGVTAGSGTRIFEDGIIGKCLVTGNLVRGQLPNVTILKSFSVGFFVNGQATWSASSDLVRLAEANGFRISTVVGTRQIIFRLRSGTNAETTLYTYTPDDISLWHHLAFTYNGVSGEYVIYWDGRSVASGTNIIARLTSNIISVAYLGYNASVYVISRIDELYFCNTPLSAKKVKFMAGMRDALLKGRTQTEIDGGIITSGRIELGDNTTIKAGIDGAGTAESSVRIWVGVDYIGRASAPTRFLQDGTMYSTKAVIAGNWIVDHEAIFSGTKSMANGFASAGFTLGSDGSIHTPRFYIDANGTVGIRSGTTTGKRVVIDSVNNRIDIYNSSNIKILTADDDVYKGRPGLRCYKPSDPTDSGATYTHDGFFITENNDDVVQILRSGGVTIPILKNLLRQSQIQNTNLKEVYWDELTGELKAHP